MNEARQFPWEPTEPDPFADGLTPEQLWAARENERDTLLRAIYRLQTGRETR